MTAAGLAMPSDRQLELALQQQRLAMRSAHLRRTLAGQVGELRTPLAVVDTGWAAARWLRRNPHAVVVPVALLAVLRPARAWRWGGRVWWGWRVFRRAGRWLASTQRHRR